MNQVAYLLVNFGGPRDPEEIEEFLIELLTDQEIIRTPFPAWLHRFLFTRVAKKRCNKVREDYDLIGGHSPIFYDAEEIGKQVADKIGSSVILFHRYLPKTHSEFKEQMALLEGMDEIRVVPLFPQFSYATTGSVALWFSEHLPLSITRKMRWVRSYPTHPPYIQAMQRTLKDFLNAQGLKENEICLLFSAHGLPIKFIETGDPYQKECEAGFEAIKSAFPEALSLISYQSQFGKTPWILPYTSEVSKEIKQYVKERKKVVFVPLSFSSDHIETLYEVEYTYLPVIREQGLEAYRCPALNRRSDWIETVADLFLKGTAELSMPNCQLLRKCPCFR